MSDPSELLKALQLENAALRQQVAQLADQQAVRYGLDTHTAVIARQQAESPREAALEAMHENEANLRAVLNALDGSIFLLAADATLLALNDIAAQRMDQPIEELIGRKVYDLPLDLLAHRTAIERVLSTGEPVSFAAEQNGRWLVNNLQPILNTDGLVARLVIFSRDITERKLAEDALRESEERAQAMLHAIPDLMFRMDRQGVFLDYKADNSDLYAQAEPSIIGQRNRDLTPPEFANLIDRQIQATLETGTLQTFEYQLPLPGRGLRSYEARMVASGADEVTAIVRDVTERKRAESQREAALEALRESELLYESLVEVSPLCICRKDLAGRFTFANQRFLEETNITLSDLVGKTDFDLHPPELAEKYRRDETSVMESGQVWELIEARTLLDGKSIVVQSIKTPIYDGTGNIYGTQTSFWDITVRQRSEEALRDLNATLEQRVVERTRELAEANLHLEELSRLKDEFITRISHELRNPLTNLKLYLKLLEQGRPEKRESYFHTLHQQADRLQHLIEDLLDVSHLTLDEIEVRAALVDVTVLLHGLITDQSARALERGLTLTAMPTPDRLTLTTDHNLLRQALSNVLTNALNYTPRAGTITLRSDRATTPEREWVMIEIYDTGPGISAQDLPHLFEPFYRGEAAADYKIPGTGVGLSVTQRLIERLGGRITVESNPGQGTTFTFWLPATPESQSS